MGLAALRARWRCIRGSLSLAIGLASYGARWLWGSLVMGLAGDGACWQWSSLAMGRWGSQAMGLAAAMVLSGDGHEQGSLTMGLAGHFLRFS
jgi:hypothetical protein